VTALSEYSKSAVKQQQQLLLAIQRHKQYIMIYEMYIWYDGGLPGRPRPIDAVRL